MKRTFRYAVLLAILLSGCAARKLDHWHRKPTRAPEFPQGGLCGQPIVFQFEDGHRESWYYPCWPEGAEPRCVKGCKP